MQGDFSGQIRPFWYLGGMQDSRIPPEMHAEALQALREAIQEGLESGEPLPFDVQDVLAEARARKLKRASSPSGIE